MRFTLRTKEQRRLEKTQSYQKWHKKFAWTPIRMTNQPEVVIWLEFVLRKGRTPNKIIWKWEYVESTFDVLKMSE